jgi:hypothetical protein
MSNFIFNLNIDIINCTANIRLPVLTVCLTPVKYDWCVLHSSYIRHLNYYRTSDNALLYSTIFYSTPEWHDCVLPLPSPPLPFSPLSYPSYLTSYSTLLLYSTVLYSTLLYFPLAWQDCVLPLPSSPLLYPIHHTQLYSSTLLYSTLFYSTPEWHDCVLPLPFSPLSHTSYLTPYSTPLLYCTLLYSTLFPSRLARLRSSTRRTEGI